MCPFECWVSLRNGINKGAVAEQFVAQEILANRASADDSSLYYWRRESATGNAEVDFLLPFADKIIPAEVKAGASGRTRSLQQFLKEKPQHTMGVRFFQDSI